ncbi:MAG: sugar transferase [Candidatus Hydrogenedentes bacterium]|nr:sugar transferase [Candidatus Hydrogenedentota bacterium]
MLADPHPVPLKDMLPLTPAGRRRAVTLLQLVDLGGFLLALGASFGMLAAINEAPILGPFLQSRVHIENYLFVVVALLVWHGIFALFLLYDFSAGYFQEGRFASVIKATGTGTLLLTVCAALLDYNLIDSRFLSLFFLVSTLVSLLGRFVLYHLSLRMPHADDQKRQTIIVGSNQRARDFALHIKAHPEMGYHLLGFVDRQRPPGSDHEQGGLLADLDSLPGYLSHNVVDEVIICLPIKSEYETIARIVSVCEEQGIPMSISTQLFDVENPSVRQRYFKSSLILMIHSSILDGRDLVLKRLLDIVIAALGIVAALPVMGAAWLLIRATSRGPAVFVQNRVGLNKRLFRLYKFRTMVQDAETLQSELEARNEAVGGHFKMKNDPRVTPIGRFLRKTSIDELPQLFNVLKGDMSIVGPRPLPVRDARRITMNWPRRRFGIRPGLTCLWQIEGRADQSITFERWMELDMKYIDEWSLWLDVKIMLRTVPAVLFGRGAY